MAIPVLVRSVGPTPTATTNYYTNWTQFVAGYPKYKNQDTGQTQAFFNGATLIAYRADYLYWTGSEIVTRTVNFDVGLIPDAGQYYDIPVTAYQPGGTGLSPNPGGSQGTAMPSGAVQEVVVREGIAFRDANQKRVTSWMRPRFVQERQIGANRWANLSGAKGGPTPASITLTTDLSTQLVAQDFGFRLPENAEIVGIETEITRKVVGGAVEKSVRAVGHGYYYPAELVAGDDLYSFEHRYFTPIKFGSVGKIAANGAFVVAVVDDNSTGTESPRAYRSTDYGKTWAQISTGVAAGRNMKGIAAAPNGTFVATVDQNVGQARILRSTDNGQTWSLVNAAVMSGVLFMSRIATDGAGTWVCGSDGGSIFYSVDDGLTWSTAGFSFSTSGGYSEWVGDIVHDGTKFVALANYTTTSGAVNEGQIANSPNGSAWTLRYQAATDVANWRLQVVNGTLVSTEGDLASADKVTYSTDHGDTWSRADLPESPEATGVNAFSYVIYDPVRAKYLWLGAYADWWSLVYESPDFPPTSLRMLQGTDAEHLGEWAQNNLVIAATFNDRYGVRHEEVTLLVGGTGDFTPADAIYDEGLAIPGGAFTYRSTFLSLGGAEDDLRNAHPKTYGGPERRGSNANNEDGAQAWTATEINAPSFGIGYQAEGTQGMLQVGGIRVRVHYRGDFANETLPAKRPQGLAGVAEAPDGTKVAVGAEGRILRKPANSGTWAPVASGVNVSLNDVAWVGDRFIAVGFGGVTLDGGATGSTWTRVDSGAVTSLWAIRRVPGTLRAVAVGSDEFAFERSRQGTWQT